MLNNYIIPFSNPRRIGEGGKRFRGGVKASSQELPLISVVTAVYNGAAHIEQTIQSVLRQGYENVDYVVVDGGSTDGTIEIIKKYEGEIDCWVSEPDSGIYNAWNKGLALVTGDVVGILSADDWYEPGALRLVANAYIDDPEEFVFFGQMQMISHDEVQLQIKDSDFSCLGHRMSVNHPTVFLSNKFYIERKFDESFKVTGDYEYFLYLNSLGLLNVHNVKSVITNMREGGASDKISSILKVIAEDLKARKIHCSKFEAYRRYFIELLVKLPKKILKSLCIRYGFDFLVKKYHAKSSS